MADRQDVAQTRIPNTTETVSSPPNSVSTPPNTVSIPPNPISPIDIIIKDTVESIDLRLQRLEEMIEAIFRYTVDQQLERK